MTLSYARVFASVPAQQAKLESDGSKALPNQEELSGKLQELPTANSKRSKPPRAGRLRETTVCVIRTFKKPDLNTRSVTAPTPSETVKQVKASIA